MPSSRYKLLHALVPSTPTNGSGNPTTTACTFVVNFLMSCSERSKLPKITRKQKSILLCRISNEHYAIQSTDQRQQVNIPGVNFSSIETFVFFLRRQRPFLQFVIFTSSSFNCNDFEPINNKQTNRIHLRPSSRIKWIWNWTKAEQQMREKTCVCVCVKKRWRRFAIKGNKMATTNHE